MPSTQLAFGSTTLEFELPEDLAIETISPKIASIQTGNEAVGEESPDRKAIHGIIEQELVKFTRRVEDCSKVIIACDDNTRVTPVRVLLPAIIDFARNAGKDAEIIVAGGSHRHMTVEEKIAKFGGSVIDTVEIFDHEWDCEDALVNFGQTAGGYELKLNARVCEPGIFLVGMGNIVPHRVCGYSGGYKILLPGLTCPDTMNKIHYLSAQFASEAILGVPKNPVREAINEIGQYRPIDFLVNTVLDGNSNIVSLCIGDPVESQYQGCEIARDIYGVPVGNPADIVITDAVPESIDFWVCAKAVTNTKSFVKKGGDLVVLAPMTEGWSPAHGDVLFKYGYRPPVEIDALVQNGTIAPEHLLEASHLSHLGEVQDHCNVHLVSDTVDQELLAANGFDVVRSADLDDLLRTIIARQHKFVGKKKLRVKIVQRGSEILPVV
ncbi:MAG TPA: lactate racemase domain-containing protein [Candidatus Lokiarchaeia archaeon]|nr:lactate racemase domain-containing protein [Candidatus Lokiarchaeia archaeon]